jgi:hypothetical protein
MGRSRAAWALIAVLISSALSDLARGGDLVECEPQRVTGDGRHWAYRIVDSRECWYPGRPGKPKDELFWGRGATLSARQTVDLPQAETEAEPSAPPSHLAAAPSEKAETTEAMPEKWRPAATDQLLAFTCCWPELEEPAPLPQLTPEGGRPPAWPLALLPLGLYALWWLATPTRGSRAVRAGNAGRVGGRSVTRRHRHNDRDGARERRDVSAIAVVRERHVRRDAEHTSPRRQCSTGLDASATSLFVLPIDEQQHIAIANLRDAPDPKPGAGVRSRLVTA